ncbi:MAG TPA: PAS domain S-box protein [Gemmataceae bacterium]|nr:PAS domain S-box protein [Gemmataceae bacterium]
MRSLGAAYGTAGAALVAAVLLRWFLDPLMGDSFPLVTLFGAVAAGVWVGGYRPALLVALLGYAACAYLFIQPRGSFGLHEARNLIGLLTYLITCSIIIGIGEAMRVSQRRFAQLTRQQDRAADVLAQEREGLRVTLASIGDAVITTDMQGRIVFLNAVAQSLTGWKHDEAAGKPLEAVFRIINEETHESVANPATRVLQEGIIVGLANHTVLIKKDGTKRPIDDSAAPIRDSRSRVVGCVLVFRDIMERRLMERRMADRLAAARLLAALVRSSTDAIITISLDGIIQSWNAAAEQLYGYSAEQAVGQTLSLLIPPDRADEEDQILARLRAGERVDHFDTIRLRCDGQPIHVSLTISPIRDEADHVVGISKISRDITDRKQAEERIYGLMAELKSADRRKDEFLAMLAHELRGPLAPLCHMLDIMKRADANGAVLQQACATIRSSERYWREAFLSKSWRKTRGTPRRGC